MKFKSKYNPGDRVSVITHHEGNWIVGGSNVEICEIKIRATHHPGNSLLVTEKYWTTVGWSQSSDIFSTKEGALAECARRNAAI